MEEGGDRAEVKVEAAEEDLELREAAEEEEEEGKGVKQEEEEEDKKPLQKLLLKRKQVEEGENGFFVITLNTFDAMIYPGQEAKEDGNTRKRNRLDNNDGDFESAFSKWKLALSSCDFVCSDCGEVRTGSASMRAHALMSHQEDKSDLVPRGDRDTFNCSLCSTRLPLDICCIEDHLSGHHPDVGGGLTGYFLSEVYRGPPPPKDVKTETR